jgi:hypothetical protein
VTAAIQAGTTSARLASSVRRCELIGSALIVLLLFAATAEFGIRGFRRALFDMQDFTVIYSSTRAFQAGESPYDNLAMNAAWRDANHGSVGDSNPQGLALYPPTTYLLLTPLALVDWSRARWAWMLVNFFSVAVLIVVVTHYWLGSLPRWQAGCAAAFILGFGPIHTGIAKGQLALPAIALLALALAAHVRKSPGVGAVFVALAACLKPQMVVPVLVLYLIQKQWKALGIVTGVGSSLMCIAWARLSLAHVAWIGQLAENLKIASTPGGVYDPSPLNPLAFQLVNASALIQVLTGSHTAIELAPVGIGLVGCLCLWQRRQCFRDLFADPAAFSAACVLGLVLLSHRYYDATVLVFVFVWALRSAKLAAAWLTIIGCLLMAFPLPALLVSLGYAKAPLGVSQALWDAAVLHQENVALLVMLITLLSVLARPRIHRVDLFLADETLSRNAVAEAYSVEPIAG